MLKSTRLIEQTLDMLRHRRNLLDKRNRKSIEAKIKMLELEETSKELRSLIIKLSNLEEILKVSDTLMRLFLIEITISSKNSIHSTNTENFWFLKTENFKESWTVSLKLMKLWDKILTEKTKSTTSEPKLMRLLRNQFTSWTKDHQLELDPLFTKYKLRKRTLHTLKLPNSIKAKLKPTWTNLMLEDTLPTLERASITEDHPWEEVNSSNIEKFYCCHNKKNLKCSHENPFDVRKFYNVIRIYF